MNNSKPPNLEKKRPVFFQLGLIVALATTLVAFEWMSFSYADLSSEFSTTIDYLEDDLIPATKVKAPFFENTPKVKPLVGILVIKEPDVSEPSEPSKVVIPDPDLHKVGDPNYDPTGEDPDEEPIPWDINKVQFKPYYESCTNVLDREQQSNCSYQLVRKHVSLHTKYPRICLESRIEGTVWLSFIVDQQGNVKDVEIIRGVHKLMDAAAVKAVSSVPQLIPAQHRGQNVSVKFKIPVAFKRG